MCERQIVFLYGKIINCGRERTSSSNVWDFHSFIFYGQCEDIFCTEDVQPGGTEMVDSLMITSWYHFNADNSVFSKDVVAQKTRVPVKTSTCFIFAHRVIKNTLN